MSSQLVLTNDSFNQQLDSLKYYNSIVDVDNYIRLGEELIQKDYVDVDSIQIKKMEIVFNMADLINFVKGAEEAVLFAKTKYKFMEQNSIFSKLVFIDFLSLFSGFYFNISSIDSAEHYLEIAKNNFHDVDTNSIKLLNYYNINAVLLQRKGDILGSISYNQKSIDIYKFNNMTESFHYIIILNNIANDYYTLNDMNNAKIYYDYIVDILDDNNHLFQTNQLFTLYSNAAIFYDNNYNKKEAVDIALKLMSTIESNSEWSFKDVSFFLEIARLMQKYGYIQEADFYLKKADEYAKSAYSKNKNNVIYLPKYYLLKHGVYLLKKDYEQAEKFILEALKIAPKVHINNPFTLANFYYNAATYYHQIENISMAENNYLVALDYYLESEANYKFRIGLIYLNLGELYSRTGLFESSKKYLDKANSYFAKDSMQKAYTTLLNHYGLLYKKLFKYELAEKYYLKSMKIQEELFLKGKIDDLDVIYNNLATLYLKINNLEKAEIYFKKALDFSESKNVIPLIYAKYLSNYSYLLCKNNNYLDGEKKLKQSVDIIKDNLGEMNYSLSSKYLNLALINIQRKNIDDAKSYFEQAHSLYKYHFERFVPNLNENERFEYYQNFKILLHSYLLFLHNNEKLISNSNTILSELIFQNRNILYKSSDLIKSRITKSNDSTLKSEYDKLQKIRDQIAKHYKFKSNEVNSSKIDSLLEVSSNIEKDLNKILKLKLNDNNHLSWQQISEELNPNDIFIQIFKIQGVEDFSNNSKTNYVAILISPDKSQEPKIINISKDNNFEKTALELLESVDKNIDANSNLKQNSLKKLYDLLFKDIDLAIGKKENIMISLDGIYHQVNLNTLINSTTNNYLIDEKNFVFGNFNYKLQNELDKTNPKLALFGNPYFDNLDENSKDLNTNFANSFEAIMIDSLTRNNILTPLPNTKIEIDEINKTVSLNNWDVSYFDGKNASELNLKALSSPTILHVATHANFIQDKESEFMLENEMISNDYFSSPLFRSFLVLSKDDSSNISDQNYNDGYLTAYEAMYLNLENTDLVVLSACESGLGVIKNGEGVYGLQRAFFYAGAKNIIMSLWKVYDKPTREFMVSFYKFLLDSNDIHAAFKKAQIELKSKYPNPYIWGSFVLIQG